MYIVISFDYGSTSDIRLHALTSSLDDARITFHAACKRSADEQVRDDAKVLVELVQIDGEFAGVDGVTGIGLFFFDGPKPPNVTFKTLDTNNVWL